MIKKKALLDTSSAEPTSKSVVSSNDPEPFRPAFSPLGHRILSRLAVHPDYPSNIARKLGKYHQTVYYHMHRLEKAGLIRKMANENVRGGQAKLYALTADGYAVEFDVKGEAPPPLPSIFAATRSRTVAHLFAEFVSNGTFDGWIVVGSPEPHGPNRTQGRDGHYAVQLGFALGQFARLPARIPVKLDVDLKTEKLESSNLVIVGGPRTNIVAAELNSYLPARFSEENFYGSMVDETGRRYFSELEAIVAKTRNPWDNSRQCLIAAGLTGAATKAAIIGMTVFAEQVLGDYSGGDFAVVLKGVDYDGDGKVDSVEVLHRVR